MLCSRTAPGSEIRASTRHYHPKHLLYRYDAPHAWHGGDWGRVHKLMATLLPEHLKASFAALLDGPQRRNEQAALAVVEWIEAEGRQLGFRVPSPAERARSVGQYEYLTRLRNTPGAGFTDRDLFDWTGNHFDPDALGLRIATALNSGVAHQPYSYLDPASILAGYDELKRTVAAEGVAVQPQPVPLDLLMAFRHATDASAAAAASAPSGALASGPPSAEVPRRVGTGPAP
jgi:hypothetical protein